MVESGCGQTGAGGLRVGTREAQSGDVTGRGLCLLRGSVNRSPKPCARRGLDVTRRPITNPWRDGRRPPPIPGLVMVAVLHAVSACVGNRIGSPVCVIRYSDETPGLPNASGKDGKPASRRWWRLLRACMNAKKKGSCSLFRNKNGGNLPSPTSVDGGSHIVVGAAITTTTDDVQAHHHHQHRALRPTRSQHHTAGTAANVQAPVSNVHLNGT